MPDPDPCGTTPKPPGSSDTPAAAPSAIDKFPFPGSGAADSSSAAPSISTPDAPQTSPATNQPSSATPNETEKKFPFPGASSVPSAPIPSTPDAVSSSSSSSSSSDAAESELPDTTGAGLKDAGSEGTQSKPSGHILHRAAPAAPKAPTADEREAEDLDVAKFYMDSGDLAGALLRAEDAVKTVPDDPDAHFALAEIAARLGKKEEAIAEYNAVLKLDASTKEKKDSNKALARLTK